MDIEKRITAVREEFGELGEIGKGVKQKQRKKKEG